MVIHYEPTLKTEVPFSLTQLPRETVRELPEDLIAALAHPLQALEDPSMMHVNYVQPHDATATRRVTGQRTPVVMIRDEDRTAPAQVSVGLHGVYSPINLTVNEVRYTLMTPNEQDGLEVNAEHHPPLKPAAIVILGGLAMPYEELRANGVPLIGPGGTNHPILSVGTSLEHSAMAARWAIGGADTVGRFDALTMHAILSMGRVLAAAQAVVREQPVPAVCRRVVYGAVHQRAEREGEIIDTRKDLSRFV